MTATSDKSL